MRSELHIELTKKCFLKCLHCSSNQEKLEVSWIIKNFDKVIELIESNSRIYSFIVSLTGGEPLLLDNLSEIIENMNKIANVESIGMFTCGCKNTNDKKIIPVSCDTSTMLKKCGLRFCYVTLHSHNSIPHDLMTNTKGSFTCAIKSLTNFKKSALYTGIHYPITSINSNEVGQIISLCDSLKIDELRLLRLVKHGRAIENWSHIGLNKKKQKEVINKLLNVKKKIKSRLKITIAGFPENWDCRPFHIGSGCQAGIKHFYLNDNGELYPCAATKLDNKSIILSLKNNSKKEMLNISRKVNQSFLCSQDKG